MNRRCLQYHDVAESVAEPLIRCTSDDIGDCGDDEEVDMPEVVVESSAMKPLVLFQRQSVLIGWTGARKVGTGFMNLPIVEINVEVKASSENLNRIQVLPTPESPISSSLYSKSYVFLAILS